MWRFELSDCWNQSNDNIRKHIESLQRTLLSRQNNEYSLTNNNLEDLIDLRYHRLCGMYFESDVIINIDTKIIQSIIDSDYQINVPTTIAAQVYLTSDWREEMLDADDVDVKYQITNTVTVIATAESMYYVKSKSIELDLECEYAILLKLSKGNITSPRAI